MKLFLAAFLASMVSAPAPSITTTRVILRVTDLDASISFYRDKVGLPFQSTFDNEFAVFDGGAILVMLQQVARKSSAPSTGLSALTEIVLETADVMKTYQEMKARGIVFTREPFATTVDGTRALYAANFRDPDGHALSITGWIRL